VGSGGFAVKVSTKPYFLFDKIHGLRYNTKRKMKEGVPQSGG
jgi:hypothetical protein